MKKNKKNISKKIKKVLESTTTKFVQIPLAGVIVFSLLLATSSFFAGAAWLKIKGQGSGLKTALATFEPVKSEKPEFQFYVMSFCPYGNQIEDLIKPVAELLKDSADIRPQYIFNKITDLKQQCQQYNSDNCPNYISAGYFANESECKSELASYSQQCLDEKQYLKIGDIYYGSLHGRVEANQNVREICAYNIAGEDKTNWWNFIDNVNKNCDSTNADTCWEDQAKKAGFDTNQITECFNTQAADLIEKEIALTNQYQVQGSPTLMINGNTFPPEASYSSDNKGSLKIGKKIFTQDQYRSSDAIKEAICASFKKAPKACKTTIKAATENTGSVAGAADDASCN